MQITVVKALFKNTLRNPLFRKLCQRLLALLHVGEQFLHSLLGLSQLASVFIAQIVEELVTAVLVLPEYLSAGFVALAVLLLLLFAESPQKLFHLFVNIAHVCLDCLCSRYLHHAGIAGGIREIGKLHGIRQIIPVCFRILVVDALVVNLSFTTIVCLNIEVEFLLDTLKVPHIGGLHATHDLAFTLLLDFEGMHACFIRFPGGFKHYLLLSHHTVSGIGTKDLDNDPFPFLHIGTVNIAKESLTHRSCAEGFVDLDLIDLTVATLHDTFHVGLYHFIRNGCKGILSILHSLSEPLWKALYGKSLQHLLEQGTRSLEHTSDHIGHHLHLLIFGEVLHICI